MKGQFPPIPEACLQALADIERDPLNLPPATGAHVDRCRGCSETRIAWLAQQDAEAQAPAGYFARLPDRVLSKLPSGPRRLRPHLALWALAAALLLAVATGGFWAGRANRAPVVEATLAPFASDAHDPLPDTPFQEGEDDFAQLPSLSPEQAREVIERVSNQEDRP